MARSIFDALLKEPERMGARTQSIKPQGTLANPGSASPLGPTLSMKTGAFLHPLLQAAKDKFPKDNPRGRWLGEMLLGDSPQRTGRVAEGIPDQYFHYNRGSRSNVSPQIMDLAAALPIASTLKLAKAAAVPAAMATGAGLLGRAVKGKNFAPTSTDDIGAALLGQSLQTTGDLNKAMVGGDAGAAALARIGNTAPQQAMELAEQMESAGRSRDEIWAATADLGYPVFRGPDGKLKFEIDDSAMAWDDDQYKRFRRMREGSEMPLKDAMTHPELYDAYPEMRDTTLFRGKSQEEGGSAAPYGYEYIRANTGFQGPQADKPDMLSVLGHESQHLIQGGADNFARGGDIRLADVPGRSDTVAMKEQLENQVNAAIESNNLQGMNYGDARNMVIETIPELKSARQRIRDTEAIEHLSAYGQYRALAGETEARAVQKRMDMTPEERAAKPFYADFDVPEADQIVRRYGDGPSAMVSYDDPADKFMEQINEARNKGQSIFVRWSPTSERDLEPGRVSRDFVSGDTHAGLSGIEITPDMDDETIARRISEYGFGRMQSPDSVPRIYYGEKVGTDSDGYQSFIPSGLALEADKDVISSLDRGYAKKKTLSEEIARNRNSLARLTERGDENSIGYDIVRESLEKNEKELSKVLKRNDEVIAEPSVDEFVGKLLDEGTSQTGIEAGGAVSARTAPTNSSSGESTDLNKTLASKEMYIPFGNKQVNVIQNPTAQEYADFRQTVKAELIEKYGDNGASGPVTRKTMDANGNTWVWSADDAVHGDMEPEISKITGREVNQNVDMLTAKANALSDETMPTASVDEFIGGLLDDELPLDEASRMQRAEDMGFDTNMYHATFSDFEQFEPWHKGASDNETSKMGYWFADRPEGTEGFTSRISDNYSSQIDPSTGDYKRWDDGELKKFRDDDELAAVMPIKSRAKKPLVFESDKGRDAYEKFMDWRDEWADYGDARSMKKHKWGDRMIALNIKDTNNAANEWLKSNGYDSIQIKNTVYDAPKGETITQYMIPYGQENLLRSKFAKFDPAKKDSANILAGAAGAGVLSGLYEPDALQDDEKMRRALLRN
jgi:hypothetical protein